MSKLHQAIEEHAQKFAFAILEALRGASIDELAGITTGRSVPPSAKTNGSAPAPKRGGRGGRLGRRSEGDIRKALDQILSVVAQHAEGVRAEEVRAALGWDRRELPLPIKLGLETGALEKTGEKRATTYLLGKGNSAESAPTKKRRGRRGGK